MGGTSGKHQSPMAASKTIERKSLCEESMLLIVNILKVFFLSLARSTLPIATCDAPPTKRVASGVGGSCSMRARHQGTRGRHKKKGGDRFADYIRRFHEKTENEVRNVVVECRASDYIKRFHDKISKDANNDSKRLVLRCRHETLAWKL